MNRSLPFALSLLAACSAEPDIHQIPRHSVSFHTLADGQPLAGVTVLANGASVGESQEQGLVHTILEGREGTPVEIRYECPETYRALEESKTLTLVTFRALDPNAQTGLRLELRCEPTSRRAAFVVDTNGRAGIPVMINEQERAVTNEAGLAHIVLDAPPGTPFNVVLATNDFPGLRPQNPQEQFHLDQRSDVFVMSREFEDPPPPRRARRRRRRQGPTIMQIIRID